MSNEVNKTEDIITPKLVYKNAAIYESDLDFKPILTHVDNNRAGLLFQAMGSAQKMLSWYLMTLGHMFAKKFITFVEVKDEHDLRFFREATSNYYFSGIYSNDKRTPYGRSTKASRSKELGPPPAGLGADHEGIIHVQSGEVLGDDLDGFGATRKWVSKVDRIIRSKPVGYPIPDLRDGPIHVYVANGQNGAELKVELVISSNSSPVLSALILGNGRMIPRNPSQKVENSMRKDIIEIRDKMNNYVLIYYKEMLNNYLSTTAGKEAITKVQRKKKSKS